MDEKELLNRLGRPLQVGDVILKQRELMKFQREPETYFKTHTHGLTRYGAARMVEEELFSFGERPRLNLNELVSYEPLGEWKP